MKKIIIYLLFTLVASWSYAGTGSTAGKKYLDVFSTLQLEKKGLKKDVYEKALRGWNKLQSEGKLHNSSILTIADFSQSSNQKRLYVIDLEQGKLLFHTYVAHGKNTGEEYARHFSNIPGSLQSSLGFYVTSETLISPKHGYALTINGMEEGINHFAKKREIIMHQADYATEDFIRKHGRLGRSFGCPAVPPELNKPIIDAIRTGTCLFMYYPDEQYFRSSSLLN